MTLLNTADAVRLGANAVAAVYADSAKVWPPRLTASVRSVGTQVASADSVLSATTLVPGLPPTRANGDLLVLFASMRTSGAAGTPALPAGWTLLGNVSANGGRIYLAGRIVDGSETAPAVSYAGLVAGPTSTTVVMAQIACLAGLNTAGGVLACRDVLGAATPMTSAVLASGGGAITTTTPNALVLSCTTRQDDLGDFAVNPAADGITWRKVAPTSKTTSGADMVQEWQWGIKPDAGLVNAVNVSVTGATSFASGGAMIAFKSLP